MSFKLFSLFVITCVLGSQAASCDENIEKIINKINDCTLFYFWAIENGNTIKAKRIMNAFFTRAQEKMYTKVTNLHNVVRETGKIDTSINTDAMFYDILYSELKDSNIIDLLKENVNDDTNIDDISKELVYSVIENSITVLEQCLFDIKTAFQIRTVDTCVNKSNPEELVEIYKVVDNCDKQFNIIMEECKSKFKEIGKTENEIEHILTFIPKKKL